MSGLLDSLKTGFDALPAAIVDAQGLGESRRRSLAQAFADGLPGPRAERWKYTPLRALSQRSFVDAAVAPKLHPAFLADIPAPRMVFVNGHFDAALSLLTDLAPGLAVQPLSQALIGDDLRAVNVLGRRFEHADETFARLNASLSFEGALVRVEADAKIAAPLQLVFVSTPADGDLAWHQRHLLELRENASLTVIEHHLATAAHRHLGNHLMHVHLKPGAQLLHARVQDEDAGATLIARTDAALASDAQYRRVDLELGAGLSRHELNVALQGKRADFVSGGVLLAGGRRHVDTRLGIEHVARDTRCDLLWRGLAAERGRAVFHGGITIREGADGTAATLSNKNLLLSDSAEIDTQPVLEIYADEVKAAHGATVGRLDAGHLFYLRARGIPEAQARALLTLAFAREALGRLLDPALIEQLSPALEARLASLEASA
ncbi:MAG TPA: Fe-S cluster assembly protein SufD [Arenimonas sp.]|uniref:Fe-S cluster assembly protein SufD n=1 Tax=Arenimonas sp. TaxID=1872635 RepID=UPI002CDED77C|nr:Fe-S cluster assembly protein SufD [Arenimonas sp.]HMB55901.1 Fe-S cluster assembly protein SufD [Arenimonas sp.]